MEIGCDCIFFEKYAICTLKYAKMRQSASVFLTCLINILLRGRRCKLLQVFGAFYFILFYTCKQSKGMRTVKLYIKSKLRVHVGLYDIR